MIRRPDPLQKGNKGITQMNIFIDLEMQNMRNATAEIRKVCCREVIEIGAVAVDEAGEHRGSFKTYVKPQYSDRISGKICDLTQITR